MSSPLTGMETKSPGGQGTCPDRAAAAELGAPAQPDSPLHSPHQPRGPSCRRAPSVGWGAPREKMQPKGSAPRAPVPATPHTQPQRPWLQSGPRGLETHLLNSHPQTTGQRKGPSPELPARRWARAWEGHPDGSWPQVWAIQQLTLRNESAASCEAWACAPDFKGSKR